MRHKNLAKRIQAQRARRHARVRAKIKGTHGRPRLSVFRSATSTYAQLIDDTAGKTPAAAGTEEVTQSARTADGGGLTRKVLEAFAVGALIGEKAAHLGITHVVFDKGPYAYHGRVKAVAEGARKSGLQF